MAAVNEIIVREYFELHEFLVRQYRKYAAPGGQEDDDPDFLVLNPQPQPREAELPFELGAAELAYIERAVVVVKAWHTDVFSATFLANTPKVCRFLEKRAFQKAVRTFGGERPPLKILVVPALPQEAQAREQSIAFLRGKGIDGVISFRTMLADLVRQVEANRNYQKSDLLQTIRILKHYDFLKGPQMELFKPVRKREKVQRRDRSAEKPPSAPTANN